MNLPRDAVQTNLTDADQSSYTPSASGV